VYPILDFSFEENFEPKVENVVSDHCTLGRSRKASAIIQIHGVSLVRYEARAL